MGAPGSTTAPRRVGHKGAAHLAPGNTRASFEAAVGAGVDMIEFDVLSERPDGGGELFLAHDYGALRETADPLTLREGLEHLGGSAYAGVELDVDVKLPGYGERVVRELRETGMVGRSLVSSTYPKELDTMRVLEPSLRVGWSVPRARRDYTEDRLMVVPALAMLAVFRVLLPRRALAALRARRFDAIMAHWRLVTPALVRAVAAGGGELYVWTVDDAALMAQLSAMGVAGIITNDPRLFDAHGSKQVAAL
ncbi:MAG TPA: glycerophosphodiester phosphodiesterase [Solirubrobacteraceae bacterium]|jgi:glycerophosphoryl diester phosphodiesterase|nr:glycerophosphodiester phosphodiesterase [Solirubrobacteraceae bacterium]